MITMTYGEMPTYEQFMDACASVQENKRSVDDDGFSFGNDKRMGTCTLRTHELWDEVRRAIREYESALAADDGTDPEAVGDWLSSVLFQLGFEWV